jgi:ubiquinone/menaquinone biosynthesis C-methylase UbiE
MDKETQRKWDAASRTLDVFAFADDRRLGPHKQRLFAKAQGATLMVGVGTGNDFKFFPTQMHLVAIDISPKMLERASQKGVGVFRLDRTARDGHLRARIPDSSFDTVASAFTFCSVPKPIAGLLELRRVLKPGGQLLMFEHVRSRIGPFGILMDFMTPLSSRAGPALNRDTVGNVQTAGFRLRRIENVYLDVVKIIEAVKDEGALR